jgi:hypothetical protein
MKTLSDIKQHLLGNYTARINGTLDSGELITLHIEQYLNQDREQGRFDVVFRQKSGEIDRMKSITFDELQEVLSNYKSWKIHPRDVAVWNFLRNIKEWVEVAEVDYWYSLEAVPPAYHKNGVFACGEVYTHNDDDEPVYFFFKGDSEGRYWTQLMSKREYLTSK